MTVRIASIYFMPLVAKRPLYRGDYYIPVVKKDSDPEVLLITDKIQVGQEATITGSKQLRRDLILGEEIANCVLNEWTKQTPGMTPARGPGVWIIRDTIPLTHTDGTLVMDEASGKPAYREASTDEKMLMWQEDHIEARIRQDAYIEYLILEADVLNENPQGRRVLSPVAKEAARYAGLEREWLKELKTEDLKVCQFCGSTIKAKTSKCIKCSEIVDPVLYESQIAERTMLMRERKRSA